MAETDLIFAVALGILTGVRATSTD